MKATFLITAAAAITLSSVSAFAQATLMKQHTDWGSYTYNAGGSKNCFVMSEPKSKEPADRDHGDVNFMVAKKPDGSGLEPQVRVGYLFQEESNVIVDIDGKQFTMFTLDDGAWLREKADEPTLVQAMRAGNRMTVSGQSRRGANTSYSYSLSGITAALKEAEACK